MLFSLSINLEAGSTAASEGAPAKTSGSVSQASQSVFSGLDVYAGISSDDSDTDCDDDAVGEPLLYSSVELGDDSDDDQLASAAAAVLPLSVKKLLKKQKARARDQADRARVHTNHILGVQPDGSFAVKTTAVMLQEQR